MSSPDGGIDRLAAEALRRGLEEQRRRAAGAGPVWSPPEPTLAALAGPAGRVPWTAAPVEEVVAQVLDDVLPYPTGNTDPRFLGWVHGGGDPLGVVAAVVAASMNANTGGRDHAAVHVEATVRAWLVEVFGFRADAGSVLVQGTSEANLLALAVARTAAHGRSGAARPDPRDDVVYVGAGTHDSVAGAAELLQYGHVRVVPAPIGRPELIDPDRLAAALAADRAAGLRPVVVVGSAGTIDGGDTDDLDRLADVCHAGAVWFHVDGAFGAWLRIAPSPFDAPVRGIDRADSLALDLHKWLPVPFAVAALLVRDAGVHRSTFATSGAYLAPSDALGGGPDWAVNYGVALSRPFQGLAPYMILRARGFAALGEAIAHCVVLAAYFGDLVARSEVLRLVRPVVGNVVLFEPVGPVPQADALAADLQRRGESVVSTTMADGRRVLRACFVNHRTRARHVEEAIGSLEAGVRRAAVVPG